MDKPVRMADIAERLGISIVSVSKALGGKPGVSDEMRAKVVTMAQQLGYEGIRTYSDPGNTGNIGVLVADRFFGDNTFYASLYRSVAIACGAEGYACMIEIISPKAEQTPTFPAIMVGRKVDGIIIMGNLSPRYLESVTSCGLPCVLLDSYEPGIELDCIVSDNVNGGYTLTKHLLDQGLREIGYVGSIRATSSIMDRYLGYHRALRIAECQPRDEWLLEDRNRQGDIIPFVLPDQLPQAFVCNCDYVAYRLVETLRQRGKQIPEDIAVCGYDDFSYATLCQPQLTSYRVNVEGMAETSVERLVRRIRQEPVSPTICILPGQMIVRKSSQIFS